MDKQLYEKFFDLEDKHWWFQARKNIVFELLSHYLEKDSLNGNFRALDVGCGTGLIAKEMENKYKINVTGIDNSPKAVRFCKRRGLKIILNAAEQINQPASSSDLVTALDIIEHLKKDSAALEEFNRVLKMKGLLLVTVPAFQFLFDSHDVINHHKRRYTTGELKQKVESAGFEVVKISYYNTFLFPLVLIAKLFKKITGSSSTNLTEVNHLLNYVLKSIFSKESAFLKYFNFPFGVSIICFAKKIKNIKE